jgi:hypothetical protein
MAPPPCQQVSAETGQVRRLVLESATLHHRQLDILHERLFPPNAGRFK